MLFALVQNFLGLFSGIICFVADWITTGLPLIWYQPIPALTMNTTIASWSEFGTCPPTFVVAVLDVGCACFFGSLFFHGSWRCSAASWASSPAARLGTPHVGIKETGLERVRTTHGYKELQAKVWLDFSRWLVVRGRRLRGLEDRLILEERVTEHI